MRQNPSFQSGRFNPRALGALALFSVSVLLTLLAFAARTTPFATALATTPPAGTPSFAAPTVYALAGPDVNGQPPSMVQGDFNGDGIVDIAEIASGIGPITGGILVFLGDGDGSFKAPVLYPAGVAPRYLR